MTYTAKSCLKLSVKDTKSPFCYRMNPNTRIKQMHSILLSLNNTTHFPPEFQIRNYCKHSTVHIIVLNHHDKH